MAKIFITQSTRHPVAKAEAFGELVVLHFGDVEPGHDFTVTSEMMDRSALIMHEQYNPEEDFILLTGNPLLIGWAMHLAFEVAEQEGSKTIQWLYWDRREECYANCRVPVPSVEYRECGHTERKIA